MASTTFKDALTLEQQVSLCQQIAQLARARLPLSGRLADYARQSSHATHSAAEVVEHRLEQGKSLSDALAGDPSRNSRILAATLRAGERSSRLDVALESWTGMHIANSQANKALRTALVYPMLLIATTLASIGIVVWTLIPEYHKTYELFNQPIPVWVEWLVTARENLAVLLLLTGLVVTVPWVAWYLYHSRSRKDGLPRAIPQRLRIQSHATKLAQIQLDANVPLAELVPLCLESLAAPQSTVDRGFDDLRNQIPVDPLPSETSMVLASLHVGLIDVAEASQHLESVSSHLRRHAEWVSTRQIRWLPMVVSILVGAVVLAIYAVLIYMPWVALLQRFAAPGA